MIYLPEEIIQHILFQLRIKPTHNLYGRWDPVADDRLALNTLLAASLTCKTLQRTARKALYHTIDFAVHDRHRQNEISLLIRTLVEHSDTAALVRQVHAQAIYYLHTLRLSAHLLPPMLLAVNRSKLASQLQQSLIADLTRGCRDAELALLLCMCTNIEVLDLHPLLSEWPFLSTTIMEESLLQYIPSIGQPTSITGRLPSFRQLRRIKFGVTEDGSQDRPCVTLQDLLPVLRQPSLRTFGGSLAGCRIQKLDSTIISSSIRGMHMEQVCIPPGAWQAFFCSFPELETLTIQLDVRQPYHDCRVDWSEVGNSLRSRACKLKTLGIEFTIDCFRRLEESIRRGAMGSLVDTTLKTLSVPAYAHLDIDMDATDRSGESDSESLEAILARSPSLSDILPASLRTLQLNDIVIFSCKENQLKYDIARIENHINNHLSQLMSDEGFKELDEISFFGHEALPAASGWEALRDSEDVLHTPKWRTVRRISSA